MENISSILIPGILALLGIGIFVASPKFLLSWDRRTGYWIYKHVLKASKDEQKALRAASIFYKIFGACFFFFALIFLLISLVGMYKK